MIGHDDEFMQKIFPLITVVHESLDQKGSDLLPPENRLALGRDRGDKEDAIEIHFVMLRQRGMWMSVRHVTRRVRVLITGTQGLKAGSLLGTLYAALKGGSSTSLRRLVAQERIAMLAERQKPSRSGRAVD